MIASTKKNLRFLAIGAMSLSAAGCAHNPSPSTMPSRADHPTTEATVETGSGIGQELIGRDCRVRFRRDVLGIAGQAYIAPDADTAVPGQPLYVEGIVQSVSRQAIVLRGERDRLIWIPMGNVLMVETEK